MQPIFEETLDVQSPLVYPKGNTITQAEANEVVNLWKKNFPNVKVIQQPSDGSGKLTLAHGISGSNHMDVNGLKLSSPLFTMALFSTEVAPDAYGKLHYASAYEIMFPNIGTKNGQMSNMSLYKKYLNDYGLDVHSDHYHWKTNMLHPAIHHMGVDMSPLDFSQRTIFALKSMIQDTKDIVAENNTKKVGFR